MFFNQSMFGIFYLFYTSCSMTLFSGAFIDSIKKGIQGHKSSSSRTREQSQKTAGSCIIPKFICWIKWKQRGPAPKDLVPKPPFNANVDVSRGSKVLRPESLSTPILYVPKQRRLDRACANICAGSPEPLLLFNAMNTIIFCAGLLL